MPSKAELRELLDAIGRLVPEEAVEDAHDFLHDDALEAAVERIASERPRVEARVAREHVVAFAAACEELLDPEEHGRFVARWGRLLAAYGVYLG